MTDFIDRFLDKPSLLVMDQQLVDSIKFIAVERDLRTTLIHMPLIGRTSKDQSSIWKAKMGSTIFLVILPEQCAVT